jgi:hypothetical protein
MVSYHWLKWKVLLWGNVTNGDHWIAMFFDNRIIDFFFAEYTYNSLAWGDSGCQRLRVEMCMIK